MPVILQFPEALPVSSRRDDIARAIATHPVVIVSGETGSGKTTQLPKICLHQGLGSRGLIGHTQPRRLAATSVARRIAEELQSPLGTDVGYKIRFNDTVGRDTRIKLMTDGILLAESLSDPMLKAYDTLIIDEAHERSLNIDFLLGYLKGLIEGPRRHDLKLIITSATIDAERFATHFGFDGQRAPVIEVSGRTYPVEIRWRPLVESGAVTASGSGPGAGGAGGVRARPQGEGRAQDDDETDLPGAIEAGIDELWREGPGDVLVFLPGEREIRETAEHLRRAWASRGNRAGLVGSAEILSLFARLSAADQQRVFAPSGQPRVVLATNVAETSLTVPGIRYVIDTGLARVKRYRYRGKVEQLQIEPVSQAAARQRAGRCGRVAAGICIRLYDEPDFNARPAFTDPEILRSSLASVILRMKALRLADIEAFPFVDPPPRRAIVDGQDLLRELDAIDERNELTSVGRQLARLPLDPRIGRMLLTAHQRHCLREMLVIAAALSTQDPRERPLERQQAADQAHARFTDARSDFASLIRLWDYWQQQLNQRKEGESRRALASRLEREFLSNRKLREWADVHAQLREAVTEMRWAVNPEPAEHEAVHRALLSGLLGNLGCKAPEEPHYLGTHATRFWLHPGSGLSRRSSAAKADASTGRSSDRHERSASARWVMAAEMVDTGRLYGRTLARIEPHWIEQAASHLIRKSWSEPHWERKAGQAVCFERGVLYGLTLYTQRRVHASAIDPRASRELLIREGLVAGDWESDCAFFVHNRKLIAEVHQLEARIRRPDLLVDEQFLQDWYESRIPAEICTGQALEKWWRQAVRQDAQLLRLNREQLLRKQTEGVDDRRFPARLVHRGVSFETRYHFEPGADDDGVTLEVPLYALNQVDAVRTEWLVPGMLADKVQALLRSLGQRHRRHLVPIETWASGFAQRIEARIQQMQTEGESAAMDPCARPLLMVLIEDLREQASLRLAASDFRLEAVPSHLQMRFRVSDEHGRFLGASRHLAQLRAELGSSVQGSFQQALRKVAIDRPVQSSGPRLTSFDRRAAVDASASLDASTLLDPSAALEASTPLGAAASDDRARAASVMFEAGSAPHSSRADPHTPAPSPARKPTGGQAGAPGEILRRADERFTTWSFGRLPELLELSVQGPAGNDILLGYPALLDDGDAVRITVHDEPHLARRQHLGGLSCLVRIALREPLRFFGRNLPDAQKLSMLYMPFGGTDALRQDLVQAVLLRTALMEPWPDDETSFDARIRDTRPRITLVGNEIARTLGQILDEHAALQRKLAGARNQTQAHADLTSQLTALLPRDFLCGTPLDRLTHLPRYLKAASARIDKLRTDPARDARLMTELSPLLQNLQRARAALKGEPDQRLDEFRWMIEELRVSLFAQELRTPMPVSVKRLQKIWESMR